MANPFDDMVAKKKRLMEMRNEQSKQMDPAIKLLLTQLCVAQEPCKGDQHPGWVRCKPTCRFVDYGGVTDDFGLRDYAGRAGGWNYFWTRRIPRRSDILWNKSESGLLFIELCIDEDRECLYFLTTRYNQAGHKLETRRSKPTIEALTGSLKKVFSY